MNLTSLPLLCLVLFGVSWLEWYIFGRKGDAMLIRSPSVMFWVAMEVLLAAVMGFGLYDAYSQRNLTRAAAIVGVMVAGSVLGVGKSGLIDWSKYDKRLFRGFCEDLSGKGR